MSIPTFLELQSICREFDIGDLLKIEERLGGYANLNIKIQTDKGKYVIRFFLNRIEEFRLQYAAFIISQLKSIGIPALEPEKNKIGNPFILWKGNFVQVTPFISAKLYHWRAKQTYQSGKTLKEFHEGMKNIDVLTPESTGVYQYYSLHPNEMISGLLKEGHRVAGYPLSDYEECYKRISEYEYDSSTLPKTIIHGDWNPWNQLYNLKNEVCCVMDFDSLQRGERLFDVAYSLYFILVQKRKKRLAKTFLKGYGSMTSEEKNALPTLIGKIGLFFGVFVKAGDFDYKKTSDQLLWLLSMEGRETIGNWCVTE